MSSPFASEPKARLAQLLAEVTPGDLNKTIFSTGGAEANEAAIKLCRLATGKFKIISRYRSYHGSTQGAMTVARDYRSWPNEPGIPGVVYALDPYCYRCPFGLEHPHCDLQCAQHIEDVIRLQGGRRYVAALIVEPIVGSNGIIVPPDGYMQRLREICDQHEVLLIADEVMTGFGRTGEWFACDLWGVVPDIMTMAKGITGGYVPLGATVVRQHIADAFDEEMLFHGHTYSGHELACAAGVRTIEVYKEDNLIQRAREMGQLLLTKAEELKEKHPAVGDIRGKGLFVGLELVKNRETKEPMVDYLEPLPRSTVKHAVLAEAMRQGLYIMPGVSSVIILAPPLTITEDEIEWAASVLDDALVIADKETTP
jgi:taurine--2-oxoglutarate transaminase